MNPGIDIGERIRLVFKKTGWSVAYFAQQIQKDRTIAYNIFKRKIIDTSLLYDISMALNTDFLTSSMRTPKPIIKQWCDPLMTFHKHCSCYSLLTLR